jgi:hypothetical protein
MRHGVLIGYSRDTSRDTQWDTPGDSTSTPEYPIGPRLWLKKCFQMRSHASRFASGSIACRVAAALPPRGHRSGMGRVLKRHSRATQGCADFGFATNGAASRPVKGVLTGTHGVLVRYFREPRVLTRFTSSSAGNGAASPPVAMVAGARPRRPFAVPCAWMG